MKRKIEGGEVCDVPKNKDQEGKNDDDTRLNLESTSSTTSTNIREVGENNIKRPLALAPDDFVINVVLNRGQDFIVKLCNKIKESNNVPHKNLFIGFRITSFIPALINSSNLNAQVTSSGGIGIYNTTTQVSTTKIVWYNIPFNHFCNTSQSITEYIRTKFSNNGGLPLLDKPFWISQIFRDNSNATYHITSPKCEYSFVHILPATNIKILQNIHCSDELAFIVDSSVPLVEKFVGPGTLYEYKK
jgi:hypothetical protein